LIEFAIRYEKERWQTDSVWPRPPRNKMDDCWWFGSWNWS